MAPSPSARKVGIEIVVGIITAGNRTKSPSARKVGIEIPTICPPQWGHGVTFREEGGD